MNKYIKLFLCICFALLANSVVCYASTSEVLSTSEYLKSYSSLFASTLNSPYQAKESDGYVDTTNANMTVNVEDLYISGKNGLDLSIKRVFKTETSPMGIYCFKRDSSKESVPYGYSRTYICQQDNKRVTIYFSNEMSMYEAGDSFKGRKYSTSPSVKNTYGTLAYILGEYTYNLASDGNITKKYFDSYNRERCYSYEFTNGYLEIGNGWSLQLPALVKYDFVQKDTSYKYYLIFQDRLGNLYNFNVSTDKTDDGIRYMDDVSVPKWKPFTYTYYNNSDVTTIATHTAGFEYNIVIKAANGDAYYFLLPEYNTTQYYLKAISDRYGNIITFNSDETNYIITDTYGDTYTVNDTGIKKGNKELVKYTWERINGGNDTDNNFTHDDDIVFSVSKNSGTSDIISDNEPHKTIYYHKQKYQLSYPLLGWKYLIYKLPYKIETPGGLEKHFEYDVENRWCIGGTSSTTGTTTNFYYVSKYYETYNNITLNKVDYSFNIVTHSDSGDNNIYDTTETYYIDNSTLKTIKTSFHPDTTGKLPVSVAISANKKKITYDYEYLTGNPYPVGLITSNICSQSGYINTKSYEYNTYGQLTKEINGDYACNYTYYTNNYHLPHTQTYKKDANTTVKIENLLTTDGKNIATQNIYENDVIKSTVNYTYDANGNVTCTSTFKDDGTSSVINYAYTYGTSNYTVTTTQTGLVNADGEQVDNIVTSKTYDFQNNLLSQTDGNGNTTSYTYDNANRLLSVTYPDGTSDTYTYDISNNVTTLVTKTGAIYKVYFDGNGNAVKYTKGNPEQVIEQAEYDNVGRLVEYQRIYSDNNKTIVNYTYDGFDRLTSESVCDNDTQISGTQYSYTVGEDSNDRLTNTVTKSITGGDYATEQVTYDYMGNAINQKQYTTDSERVYTYTYDYVGNMLTQTDPKGNVNLYTYDYANRIASNTNAEGSTKTYAYNMLGLLANESDYNGNNTTYIYDDAGRLLLQQLPNGALTKSYYDANGNVIKAQTQSNAEGEAQKFDTVEYAYDNLNRLLYSAQYPNADDPIYTNYEYATDGSALKVVYGNNANSTTQLSEDAAQINYIYDVYGNPVTMTTHELTESYTYDLQGRMLSASQGKTGETDKRTESYSYNGFDNVTSKTATLPDGQTESMSYTYNSLGSIASMTDSTGTTTYAYSPYGELLTETKGTTVKTYAYDNMSNRTQFALSVNGVQNINTSYTYDSMNRLASVTDSGKTVAYSYDNNSNLLQTVKADGSVDNYTYNNVNLVIQKTRTQSDIVKESYAYSYYLNGNIRSQSNTLPKTVNQTYTYDGMGRLTNETVSGDYTINDTYTYDKRGNRIKLVSLDGTTTYTYNKNNQLLNSSKVTDAKTINTDYYYDNYGNRISKVVTDISPYANGITPSVDVTNQTTNGTAFYEYDAFNRLVYANANGFDTTYTYDGNNMRQSKTVNSASTSEIYDGANLVAMSANDAVSTYIRGNELEFYNNGGSIGMYATNSRGDITKNISLDGTVHNTYAYSAYGINMTDDAVQIFGFNGEVADAETGLIYLRNRYYDPETGTFLTQDPVKDGLNWYAYCAGDPINYTDPWGLISAIFVSYNMSEQAEVRKEFYTQKYQTESYVIQVTSAKDFVDSWNSFFNIANENNIKIDAIEIISHGSIDGKIGKDQNGTAYSTGYIYFTDQQQNKLYARDIDNMKFGDYSVEDLTSVTAKELNVNSCNSANKDTYNIVYGFMQRNNITGATTGFDGGAKWDAEFGNHIRGGGDYEKNRPWYKGGPWYGVIIYQHTWLKYVDKINGVPVRNREGVRVFY